jgi:hypothetical protein
MARCECLNYAEDDWARRVGLGLPAWRLQHNGYAVLPLARGAKKPHRMLPWSGNGRDGVHHATQDYGAVLQWWGADPAANIGVATGAASGLVVLDLDVKREANGIQSLYAFLQQSGLELPASASVVRTPSGGYHIWLRTPPSVAVPERPGILPGVDVKGDGGLVVAPPSMLLAGSMERPGESRGTAEVPVPYTWVAGCPCTVPNAPAWVLPWLLSVPSPSGSPATREGETGEAPDLASLKATGIPRGQRNAEMYRLACSLFRKHGTGPEESVWVKEQLTEVWRAGDRSGFTPGEMLTVIDSARRFVQGQQEEDNRIIKMGEQWASRGMRR